MGVRRISAEEYEALKGDRAKEEDRERVSFYVQPQVY